MARVSDVNNLPATGGIAMFYTGSSITPQGGGVFRYNIVKATPWAASARIEVRLFLPPETP